jgi:hypothetical protein
MVVGLTGPTYHPLRVRCSVVSLSLILFDVLILPTDFLIKSCWKHIFTKTHGIYQYKSPIL